MFRASIEIEQKVLGCMILFPDLFADRIEQLSGDLFTGTDRQDVYQALRSAHRRTAGRYDEATVISCLKDRSNTSELVRCCEQAFKTTPLDEHIAVLLQAAQDRFLWEQLEAARLDDSVTPHRLREIADLAERSYSPDSERGHWQIYDRYVEGMTQPRDTLYLRYRRLDSFLGGLRRGTLFIIGARPSVGKTALSLNIAQNVAAYGRKVAFFSLEMTADQICERLASRGCSIDYGELHSRPNIEMQQKVRDYFTASGLRDRLDIIGGKTRTVEAICAYIIGHKPDVAIVDYAQIVDTAERYDLRVKLGVISSQLKHAAMCNGCRVILLSQLRRTDGDKPPTMSDLKESSNLEQDADYVIMLHRPHVQSKDCPPEEAVAIIEKNRYGRTGTIELRFDGARQCFTEKERN